VIDRVVKQGMRPRFPSTTPAPFGRLAEACWDQSPAARPSFDQITEALENLLTEASPTLADGGGGGNGGGST
jgi:hypothetical protein